MNETDISRTLRAQAWERAKGELRAMLHTYHSPADSEEGQFEAIDTKINKFIEETEEAGLHE